MTSVLYIGGTGAISASCVAESVRLGDEVTVLNRGRTALRQLPPGVTTVTADVAEPGALEGVLAGGFDVVVDFLCFTAEDAARAVAACRGRVRQYVFISSASVYDRSRARLPVVESSPRWQEAPGYTGAKMAAEDVFAAARAEGFPVTVVRPSHTYDDAKPPLPGGWTDVDRLLSGEEVVVPGDGTSLWTLTHASDFAVGLAGLLGDPRTLGETYHVTSEEVLPWDEVYRTLADLAGVVPRLVHVPADLLPVAAPDWRWSALIVGDLRYSTVVDNSKVRRAVPAFAPVVTWAAGAARLLAWRAEHPAECRRDPATDAVLDRLVTGVHRSADLLRSLVP
jgi:nucleoside-diphosphate-sugar epimerase